MRQIFRLRNLVILAIIATVIGVVVSRRSTAPIPAYPDPWVAPTTPGLSGDEATESMGANGVASTIADASPADS